MVVETDAERLEFLTDWDTAIYNGATTISCIFDAEYVDVLEDSGVESISPAALCRTTDVSTAVHGDVFVHNTISYKVRGVKPTGDGFTLLKLQAA